MRGRSASLVALAVSMLVAGSGCSDTYHPEYHPVSSYTVNQSVSYPTIYQVGGGTGAAAAGEPVAPEPTTTYSAASPSDEPAVDPSRVIVVEAGRLDRPGEVVAVLDVQDPGGTRESGLEALRKRAAELGADAVVNVELHRGEAGRSARASGLAVRFDRAGR